MKGNKEVVVIGGGPAGLAAAIAMRKMGVQDILVVEREKEAGGILRQCIHDGFGLIRFRESISGPEYADRFIREAGALGIEIRTNTTVIALTGEKCLTLSSPGGLELLQAKAVVLAMGCRERTRGALAIPGERPSGVYTAGVAQNYMNLCNLMVGRKAVILGSGDIGLIMARRLALEGVCVEGVYEILPYASGLRRNILQCLEDYGIPLHLKHTVTNIHGKGRLTGVTVSQVDEHRNIVPGTEKEIACDTLILSVGLIPENELTKQAGAKMDQVTGAAVVDEFYETSVAGIFAAGNVLHVHDLADQVSLEAERMAKGVRLYLNGTERKAREKSRVVFGEGIRYVVPQYVSGTENFTLSFRVARPVGECKVLLKQGGKEIAQWKRRGLLPAEMEQIEVDCKTIEQGREIEVMLALEGR